MTLPKSELRDLTHHLKEADSVVFIIGAGASISAGIPSAPGLIEKIKENGMSH